MAENSGQEKTEKATPKKRRDARKKGNVFQSKDLISIVSIAACFYAVKIFSAGIVKHVSSFMRRCIDLAGRQTDYNEDVLHLIFHEVMLHLLRAGGPILLISAVTAVIITMAQTRMNFSYEAFKPDFKKLNPLSGLKKMFALKNVVELLKNLVKVSLLIFISYDVIIKELDNVAMTMNMEIGSSVVYLSGAVIRLVNKVAIGFLAVSLIDYLYQKWDYEKQLMMTKQEVKEEFKQTEGNPEIKGRIKELQRRRARQRMMQAVPQADVVIKNPTHFAVALQYDMDKDEAPVVVAKGVDSLALRIIDVAEKNGVYVVENRPLARSLYKASDIGRHIAPEFYGAVADLLVYVYRMKNKLSAMKAE